MQDEAEVGWVTLARSAAAAAAALATEAAARGRVILGIQDEAVKVTAFDDETLPEVVEALLAVVTVDVTADVEDVCDDNPFCTRIS